MSTLEVADRTHAANSIDSHRHCCAESGSARRGDPTWASGVRRRAHGLERHDRSETSGRRPLPRCFRCHPVDPLRARPRPCAGC